MPFDAMSGLRINMSKIIIHPVNVVPNLEELAEIMFLNIGSFTTTYLGLPLRASRKAVEFYNVVIENLRQNWHPSSNSTFPLEVE